MRCLNTSFPFFIALYALCFFKGPSHCYSQKTSDSISYYYKAILNPQSPADLPNGIRFYGRKKEQDLIHEDTLSAIRDLRMISIGQFEIGNVYDSENSIVEALNLITNLKTKDTLIDARIGLYNQLGRIYRTTNNHEEAIKAFDEALKICKKTKDSITILNNKANIYKDLQQYELARDQYAIVHAKSRTAVHSLQLAMALDNLGYVQSKIGVPEALNNIIRAKEIRAKQNDLTGLYASYRTLANYYLDRGNNEMANSYANKGYETAKRINSISYIQDALSLSMDIEDNPKVREYKRLTDSISKAKQLAANKNAFIKYNLQEERKKTEASRLLQEKEKGKRVTYQSISAIILIILIASYFIFRYRYKKGKIEEVYKTETRISKRVHDEVANDVYQVMTKLQSAPNVKEEWLDDLDIIYSKTRDISKELSALDLQDDFEELLGDLLLSYNSEQVNVLSRDISEIDWDGISNHRKTAIYRVLQELMTNMKKHSKATVTTLSFGNKGNKVVIEYSDNGVGGELKKRNGLQNAENRIASINGSLTFKSQINKGFKVTIIA